MTENHPKTAGRRASVLGMSLLALIALAAIAAGAAQASPTWSVGGKNFLGTETVSWWGENIEFQRPKSESIRCGYLESTEANIAGGKEGAAALHLSACVLKTTGCKLPAVTLNAHTRLIKAGGVDYEKFTPSAGESGSFGTWESGKCLSGTKILGSFAAQVGPEAVEATRTFSAQAEEATGATGLSMLADAWTVRGSASVSLSGANKGAKFGAKDPVLGWHIEGHTLEEKGIAEAEFSLTGGAGSSFQIEIPSNSAHFECTEVSGSGVIRPTAAGEASLSAGKCVLVNSPHCEVQPIQMTNASIGLTERENGEILETFAPHGVVLNVSGELCPWFTGKTEVLTGKSSFGAEAGPEAVELTLGGSKAFDLVGTYASNTAYVFLNGPFTQKLKSGAKFSTW